MTAAETLRKGGVVLLPTDTVYGLAVSPLFPAAVDRLYRLKRRPRSQFLPLMVASQAQLESLGLAISASAARLLASPLVPGALTIAFGFREGPRPAWLDGRDEVAVRIPDDDALLDTLRTTGPLLVTSANAHGVGSADSMEECLAQLDGAPDLAIDGGRRATVPSTLVNCRLDPPVVERVGTVPPEEIERWLI